MATALKTDVACKLPNGLVVEHMGHKVTLLGSNDANAKFGFGITRGVDADWFGAWAKTDGKDLPAVKNGSIFAMSKDADGAARERKSDASVQTGQEPLNPFKPAADIEPTEEMKKELDKGPDPDAS